jgi:hypothetical protein
LLKLVVINFVKMANELKGIDYLLNLNSKHSQAYIDLAAERRRYRGEHPTEIAALKCMDGRLHLPVITKTALGIIQPFRNLGGKFDLGWPFFQSTLNNWVEYSTSRGRHCLVFVTYHFARGDKHRGCRGFNYDAGAAKATAEKLRDQFRVIYGNRAVVPIVCGIETDMDALILHGENGQEIDLSTVTDSGDTEVESLIRELYPSMPERMRSDMLPLVKGNIEHIADVKAANRPIADAEHREWVLGVGRGFDWLHAINTAFIVGPYDPNLAGAIETAARLLKGNVDEGRVDKNGLVLLTSASYRDSAGPEHALAREKAKFLSKFALDIVKEKVPDLVPNLQILTGCVDLNTRKFEIIERKDKPDA